MPDSGYSYLSAVNGVCSPRRTRPRKRPVPRPGGPGVCPPRLLPLWPTPVCSITREHAPDDPDLRGRAVRVVGGECGRTVNRTTVTITDAATPRPLRSRCTTPTPGGSPARWWAVSSVLSMLALSTTVTRRGKRKPWAGGRGASADSPAGRAPRCRRGGRCPPSRYRSLRALNGRGRRAGCHV